MKQLVSTMFITNNHASFHLWWNENLVKHQKVSKCYEHDCSIDKFLDILMYNWLCNKKQIIFSLQVGFWQKYSTTHELFHLTCKKRHEIDKGNYGCGIFVDFQKTFDTVDHHVLLKK